MQRFRLMEDALVPYQTSPLPSGSAVLAFAPHPDDEVFGCGGTLALHARVGDAVTVVILTSGDAAGDARARLAESCCAAQVLSLPPPICWNLPDRGLCHDEELVLRMIEQIQSTDCRVVYAPSMWEVHPDHWAVGLAALEAIRRLGAGYTLMAYEVGACLRPNQLVDITTVLALKRKAMRCFISQLDLQHYDKHINAINTFRTYTLTPNVIAAEAFERYDGATLARLHQPIDDTTWQPLRALQLPFVFDRLAALRVLPGKESPTDSDLQTRLTQLEAELEAIRRSRFWRLTYPFRTLVSWLRNVLKVKAAARSNDDRPGAV